MRASKTAQVKKDELLATFRRARQQLLEAVAAVPVAWADTPFLGTWSANDLVAHLAGWDYANLAGIRAVLAGRLPDFFSQYDADWHTFNAGLVARYKQPTLAETIAAAQTSHPALFAALDAVPAEDVFSDHGVRSPRGRRVTVNMLLSAEAHDEGVHCAQVREFVGRLSESRAA